MAGGGKVPDLWELIKKWVFDHFGLTGLAVLFLLGAAAYAYKSWDKVKTWPGVAYIITFFCRWKIPLADPHRFSVLVAHLEHDASREYERLIIEALKEFDGIQVLALDRTIPLAGPVPEERERQGQETARGYLQQSGASVLIWGMVLSRGGSTVLKLYWTPSHGSERKPQRYAAPLPEAQLRLPEVFWSDLAEILRLLVATSYADFRAKEGQYIADQLPPFIARVRKLLESIAGRAGWDSDARGATLMILADALQVLGNQSGKNEPLEEAVAAYRQALQEWNRDRAPLQWATTQNNLGNALSILGERESGTARLEEAVAACRAALQERTRDRVPLQWAATQNNLGNALRCLGERERGTGRLEEAVAAYRQALQEYARERVPLQWALTQNNLGAALASLGERKSGTALLEEALAAFRAVLQEWTRDRVPLQWAGTQNNLGNALLILGQRKSGTARLEEAVAAYRQALQERTRERVPLDWASTQNNLGNALSSLGERESGTARLKEAVAAYRQALHEYTRERVPLDWALTQNNLGNALRTLGERESGTARLEEAVDAFQAALEVFEPAQATHYVEITKANLRRAEALLHERRNSKKKQK